MKITKETLKQIIKEEVQAALEEGMPGEMEHDAAAEKLAKMFGLDMGKVKSLLDDPEVQKAMKTTLKRKPFKYVQYKK